MASSVDGTAMIASATANAMQLMAQQQALTDISNKLSLFNAAMEVSKKGTDALVNLAK